MGDKSHSSGGGYLPPEECVAHISASDTNTKSEPRTTL